jgi:hypothetical protein
VLWSGPIFSPTTVFFETFPPFTWRALRLPSFFAGKSFTRRAGFFVFLAAIGMLLPRRVQPDPTFAMAASRDYHSVEMSTLRAASEWDD